MLTVRSYGNLMLRCWVCMCVHSVMCYGLCSPPGSPVHVIFQARILEQVAIFFSRRSSQPWDWTHISCVSCTGRWVLYQLSHQRKPKMLHIVPGEGAWRGHPWCSGVHTTSVRSTAKQTWNIIFHFSPFSIIVKILFGFLLASGYRSYVKINWQKLNFWKAGDTWILMVVSFRKCTMSKKKNSDAQFPAFCLKWPWKWQDPMEPW